MNIIHINELVYAEPKPATVEAREQKYKGILAALEAPVYLGSAASVAYDHKSDRYAATFLVGDGKKLVLKASNDVVAFVSANLQESGYWQGRLEAGVLTEVYLIKA